MIRRNAALEDDDYAAVLRLMKLSRRSLAAELGVLVHQALQAQEPESPLMRQPIAKKPWTSTKSNIK